jgi:phosphoenolpyruvate carboxylase
MSRFGDETYRAKAKLYMKQLNAKTSKKSKSEKKKVPQLPPPDTLKSKDEVQSQLDEAEKELASLEKQLEDMGEGK